jgi:ESF2/ABP1 family protein
MDSSDDDTFGEDSNINENSDNSDLGEIDEIFEEDDDDDQSSMICDQDNVSGQDNLMPDESMDDAMASSWPPQNIPLAVPGDKKKKPGIIYLSSIPPGFNVSCTIAFFSQFGKVGRVFLQPDLKEKNKRKDKIARNFTEGWIEFQSKRAAKEVATNLNNTPVGGKKRAKSHDVLWNIKYLPKFKWTHLSERLAYEKAVHHQRLRTEISQAKREADFFKANVEKSKRIARKRKPDTVESGTGSPAKRVYDFRQKETDSSIRKRNQQKSKKDSNFA